MFLWGRKAHSDFFPQFPKGDVHSLNPFVLGTFMGLVYLPIKVLVVLRVYFFRTLSVVG